MERKLFEKFYVMGAVAAVAVIGLTYVFSKGASGASDNLRYPSGPFGELQWHGKAKGTQIGNSLEGAATPVLRKVELAVESAVYAWIRDDRAMEVAGCSPEDCQQEDLHPMGDRYTRRHLRCFVGDEATFLWYSTPILRTTSGCGLKN